MTKFKKMKSNSILSKITSNEIFTLIFDHIKDHNFPLKLFMYSKQFQKKFDIDIVNYEKIYLQNRGIDLNTYLFTKDNIFMRTFDKDILKNNLEKDLKKYNIEKSIIKKALIDIYTKKYEHECKHIEKKKK